MATHDYVIANGTGAAVRSDLNNALAAIVSNNSSSTEPGTTYAYQWWADTNANVLKIRNSSNDGWITLRELDGTMLIEDGSASSPGLAFADDTNTGIFSGGADEIGFATGGAERLKLDGTETVFNNPSNDVDFRVESNGQTHMLYINAGNDRIGIGHSSPGVTLDVNGEVRSHHTSNSQFLLEVNDVNRGGFSATTDAGVVIYGASSTNPIRFQTSGSEKARIDTDGRLLLGTTSSESFNGTPSALQIEGASDVTTRMSIFRTQNDDSASVLVFAKARNTSHAVLSSGDEIGKIEFYGADGNDTNQRAGMIVCAVDGTPGGNDMPGRLVFFTTPDGSASETERMRITNSGNVGIGTSSPSRPFHNASATCLTTGAAPQYRLNGGSGDSNDNDRAIFGLATGDNHFFSGTVAGDTVLRTTSGGKLLLGVGTEERFRIASNGRITAQVIYGTPLSGTTRDVFIEDGGQLGYISSVRDSKVNINLLSNVDWLYQLQPSSFNYKLTDQEGAYTGEVNPELEYGLIAEDVEPVAPELCFYDEVDGEQELRGVHYKKLIVPMLKALQEANAKITTLEAKVAALEAG